MKITKLASGAYEVNANNKTYKVFKYSEGRYKGMWIVYCSDWYSDPVHTKKECLGSIAADK